LEQRRRAVAASNSATGFMLLLRRDASDILRIVPGALEVTQKTQKELRDAYLGSTLISADGQSKEIVDLEVGDIVSSLPRWLAWLSLTGARELQIRFLTPRAISADEPRKILLAFLRSNARVDEWAKSAPVFDQLVTSVGAAGSVDEIFACVERYGPGVGGLDVLV
jgi:hypothetical protein